MLDTAILAPGAVLICWTLVMLLWMVATRFPAMAKAKIDLSARAGGRGQDLDGVIDDRTQWKAHNYNHLLEQPVLFYAVILILSLVGGVNDFSIGLAWGYAGLRVLHSLWQATVNKVPVRFLLFLLSTLCLIGLAVIALFQTL